MILAYISNTLLKGLNSSEKDTAKAFITKENDNLFKTLKSAFFDDDPNEEDEDLFDDEEEEFYDEDEEEEDF